MSTVTQRQPAEAEALLTITDVADLWKTSQDTVRRAISRGDLKAVRLPGRSIRIYPRDAQRALKPVTRIAEAGGANAA